MTEKVFLKSVLTTSSLILITVCLVNIIIDPSGVYGIKLLPPITWDSRNIKIELLSRSDLKRPTTIIFGSSRSMKVEPKFVDERIPGFAFNAAVDSATPEDFYTIYKYIINEKKHNIHAVVLGLDLESFSNNRSIDNRLLANRHLISYNQNTCLKLKSWSLLATDAVSYQYLRMSMQSIGYAMTSYPMSKTQFDERGFLKYVILENQILNGSHDLDKLMDESKKEYEKRFSDFHYISTEHYRTLIYLLDLLKKNKVTVYAYITPLHPDVISHLKETTKYRPRLNEILPKLQKDFSERQMVFKNASDITMFNGNIDEWYDGAHMTESNNRRLIKWLIDK